MLDLHVGSRIVVEIDGTKYVGTSIGYVDGVYHFKSDAGYEYTIRQARPDAPSFETFVATGRYELSTNNRGRQIVKRIYDKGLEMELSECGSYWIGVISNDETCGSIEHCESYLYAFYCDEYFDA